MSDYYILVGEQETGPFRLDELQAMLSNGEVPAGSLYARPGMPAWEPLSSLIAIDGGAPVGSEAAGAGTAPVWEELPTVYESSRYESLVEELRSISSYAAVGDWDGRAQTEVNQIVRVLRGIDQAVQRESAALENAKLEYQAQSFLKRAFANHGQEAAISCTISALRERKLQLLQYVARLQETIDFTPNTPQEKTELMKELRQRKKELQAQKREASAAMREIRQGARVASVAAGKNWLGLYDPELAADQRRGIRYAKEAALRPHEDEKAALERQLIKVERDLMWVERFG